LRDGRSALAVKTRPTTLAISNASGMAAIVPGPRGAHDLEATDYPATAPSATLVTDTGMEM
jgi:hypothetical protein